MRTFKNTHDFAEFPRKNEKGEPITTTPREIIFSVKASVDDTAPLIEKRMTRGDITSLGDGVWQIGLVPKDTAELSFGKYICDVKVIDEYGLELIVVPAQDFVILDTVTLVGG